MKKVALGLILAFFYMGCSGTRSNDPDAINDALIGFTVNSQASRWPEALNYVTDDEVDEITDGNGMMKPEYQLAAKRLKLSTLKQMEWEVDGHGRLVGIKKAMDESNERYKVSDDQRKVGTDLDQKRKARIQAKIEQGKRILAGEEKEETEEPKVEFYTNKLTEEEKRKYGSTGELRAPEQNSSTSESASSSSGNEGSPSDSSGEDEGYYGPDDGSNGATSSF
ncbi:MAG: hypothetical protein M0P13_00820 [Fibrobacteraceae bacterium]|nr:hypothetical protein [Fibrobacteraceae bacterium]